jgi:hypothetical protein
MIENLENTKYQYLVPQLSKITTMLMLKGKSDAWLSIKFIRNTFKITITNGSNEIAIYVEEDVTHFRYESNIVILRGTVEVNKIYELVKEKFNL